jgi:hypothetical protein
VASAEEITMSRAEFARDWVPFRDAVMSRFPDLDDGDLEDADGRIRVLARRLAEKTEMDPEEAEQELASFLGGPMPADSFADPAHDDDALKESARYVPAGEDVYDDDRRFGDDSVSETDRPLGRDR